MEDAKDLSISPDKVLLLGVPLSALAFAVIYVPYRLLWGDSPGDMIEALLRPNVAVTALVVIVSLVVHELLHAATWYFLSARPKPVIRFGINWQALMPYAHTATPMSVRTYRLAALAPGFIMGILPGVWGVVAGDIVIAAWAALFLVFAVGDFVIIYLLRKVPPTAMVMDHPSKVGCMLIEAAGQDQ